MVTSVGAAGAVCDATAVSSSPHTMVLTSPTISVPVGKYHPYILSIKLVFFILNIIVFFFSSEIDFVTLPW